MGASPSRREFLASLPALAGTALGASAFAGVGRDRFQAAVFSADVTPPIGHALLADLVPEARAVDDPLLARGLVLLGAGEPLVLVAVDWCEIRNEAHDRWRDVLAKAAGTAPGRVLVASVHQHDAPLADLSAQAILAERGLPARIADPEFHEQAVQQTADALRQALESPRRITHLGTGQSRVQDVASNRRYPGPDGKPRFDRGSATQDPYARAQPDGTIDPWLKTMSFWDEDRPVAAVSAYAVHPMSYYRTGRVSADFPGLARRRRQADDPSVFQIYASGASGNVTAGRYNDGAVENRPRLADRLYDAMRRAWDATRRQELERIAFRAAPLRLAARNDAGYTPENLERQLAPEAGVASQSLAALGLSWRRRAEAGHALDVPALDFGPAKLLLLPAESYVEYQLLAQASAPDEFVMVWGYGDCAPGYIPIERAWEEEDGNLTPWCWIARGAEERMAEAIQSALG